MEDNMEISARNIAHRFGLTACIVSLIANLLFVSCNKPASVTVPYYTDASFTPLWEKPATENPQDHHIAAFRFTDQHGNGISNQSVTGKIYLANFFFTSCKGICPKMLVNMKKVSDHYKNNKEVLFLSHSVTPERDSVFRLWQYAMDNSIYNAQWHLLTGNVNNIYRLARKSYFVEEAEGLSKDNTEFLHTENIVLVDQDGHLRGLYNGTLATEVTRIIADIDALLEER